MGESLDAKMPGGQTLGDGRYLVRQELGRGMMGVVFAAEDRLLGRTVALKTIDLAFDASDRAHEEFEQRFFTEARVAAKLSHPGIVVCHDVGKDAASGRLFIVFEHLSGQTLAKRIAAGPMAWREAVAIVVKVARAIHHAHEHGVIHRDLKPSNVMLLDAGVGAPPTDEPSVKIMDFGIARLESIAARLTAPGQSFGSPLYMSPEQALGERSEARSDIFSLGSILCTLLLGRAWFDAPNIPRVLARVLHDEAPVVSRIQSGLPTSLDRVVARALAKRMEERYSSAAAMADDLEDVLAGQAPRHVGSGATDREDGLHAELMPDGSGPAGERTDTLRVRAPTVRSTTAPAQARLLTKVLLGALLGTALVAGVSFLGRTPAPLDTVPRAAAKPSPPPLVAVQATESPADGHQPAFEPRPAPRPTPEPKPAASAPRAAATGTRFRLNVDHSLENGRLSVWLDGVLVLETKLAAPVSKKIVAINIREGHVDKMFDVEPGRHEVRVELIWGDKQRVGTKLVDVVPGATGLLEVKLGRFTKDLSLDWSDLAKP